MTSGRSRRSTIWPKTRWCVCRATGWPWSSTWAATRVTRRRFNVNVPRARVPGEASTLRDGRSSKIQPTRAKNGRDKSRERRGPGARRRPGRRGGRGRSRGRTRGRRRGPCRCAARRRPPARSWPRPRARGDGDPGGTRGAVAEAVALRLAPRRVRGHAARAEHVAEGRGDAPQLLGRRPVALDVLGVHEVLEDVVARRDRRERFEERADLAAVRRAAFPVANGARHLVERDDPRRDAVAHAGRGSPMTGLKNAT